MHDPRADTVRAAIIDALDDATALRDLLVLTHWAGEGIGGPQGAAIARAALCGQHRLGRMVAHLHLARDRAVETGEGAGDADG